MRCNTRLTALFLALIACSCSEPKLVLDGKRTPIVLDTPQNYLNPAETDLEALASLQDTLERFAAQGADDDLVHKHTEQTSRYDSTQCSPGEHHHTLNNASHTTFLGKANQATLLWSTHAFAYPTPDAATQPWIGRHSEETVAYYGVDGHARVVAMTGRSGTLPKTAWTYSTAPKDKQSNAAQGGGCAFSAATGTVFVTTPYGELNAFSADSGTLRWTQPLNAPPAARPIVSHNTVLCLNTINQLEAFDAHTGHPLWSHVGLSSDTHLLSAPLPAVFESKRAGLNPTCIVTYSSGETVAINLSSGVPLWVHAHLSNASLDKAPQQHFSPVIRKGIVYCASSDTLRALSVESGAVFWEKDLTCATAPTVFEDILLVMTQEDVLLALDMKTGDTLWSYNLTPLGPVTPQGACFVRVLDNRLFVMRSGLGMLELHLAPMRTFKDALRAGPPTDISLLLPLKNRFNTPPQMIAGHLYILSDVGTLSCYAPGKHP